MIAELAYGISTISHDERAQPIADGLEACRSRFGGRIFAFTEEAALNYGDLMGEAAPAGPPMSAPDGMIAAIARVHSAPLATRNVADFRETGVVLVNLWVGCPRDVSRPDPRPSLCARASGVPVRSAALRVLEAARQEIGGASVDGTRAQTWPRGGAWRHHCSLERLLACCESPPTEPSNVPTQRV